jgi:TP901 family phage tail tape measure protein
VARSADLVIKLAADADGVRRGVSQATRETDRFGRSAGRTSRASDRLRGAFIGTAAAAGALGTVAAAAIARQTIEFDKGMRNVNSIAQLSERSLGALQDRVLDLAGPTAQSPKVLAEGLYDLVSSGFSSAESMKVLGASARAATAGLTTTDVSTRAVAAALNAYRLPAKSAAKVSDVLFRTVDRGVISFEQLSEDIGDVLPFASSLGVQLHEVGASVATMTKSGISSAETMTRIKAIMSAMLKPGEALSAAMSELGYSSGEAFIKAEGFQGALDKLVKSTGGSKAAVAELFPNIRALGGALALTGENSRGAAADLRGMEDASGATSKALSQQSQSISFQWNRLKATAEALGIQFGMKMVPTVREVFKILNADITLEEKLDRLSDKVMDLVTEWGPALAQRAGEVGVRMAGALVKGFVETGLLGKLAIGALAIRMFGGMGAVTAAGAKVGMGLSAGINTAMLASAPAAGASTKSLAQSFGRGAVTSNIAGMGAAASQAATAFKGLGVQMGVVAAAVVAFEGGKSTYKIWFEKPAEGLSDRLGQIEAKAGSLHGRLAGWFEKAPKILDGILPGGSQLRALSQATGLFNLDDDAASAKSLKSALTEIGSADSERFMTLRGIIRQRVNELDLTREQRKEINGIIADSKVGKTLGMNARVTTFTEQARSGMFVGADLQKATDQQLAKITATYNRYTPQWRNSVWKVLKAQEDAVRRAWTKNGKLTREGIERIKSIQNRRKNLLAGADPYGIARGLVNSWKKAGAVNQQGLSQMTSRLKSMPPKARAAAARTMLDYARELEQKGKLPEGSVKKLRSRLLLQFGSGLWKDMKQATTRGFLDIGAAFRTGTGKAESEMRNFEGKVRSHSRKVKSSIGSIPSAAGGAYSRLASYTNEALGAFESDKNVSLSFMRRGGTARRGSGLVPTMVSPGELISHRGREIVVPGKPTRRDSVFMPLPPGAKVFTYDGQARLAAGETPASALQKQLPHFRTGGTVPNPRITGGSPPATAAGNGGIRMVRPLVQKYVDKYSLSSLDGVTKLAAKYGLQMTSGLRPGDDGWHGQDRARDYSNSGGPTPQMYKFAKYLYDNHSRKLLELIYTPLGAAVKNYQKTGTYAEADHYDHVHVAMRKGGVVKGYGGGGTVRSIDRSKLPKRWGADQLATLAYFVGMKNPGLMAQIALAESGGNPSLNNAGLNSDGSIDYGLWQINSIHGHSPSAMYDPIKNARAAADILSSQGIGAWSAYNNGSYAGHKKGTVKPSFLRFLKGGAASGEPKKPKLTPKQKKARGKSRRLATRALSYAEEVQDEAKNSKLAQRAVNAAKKAVSLTKDGEFGKANKWTKRAKALAKKAAATIPGLKPQRPPFATGKFDKNDPFSPTNLPGFKLLPEPVKKMLMSPGLSWEGRRNIADMALDMAGTTATKKDDAAAYNMILGLEKGRRKRAQKQYRRASAVLAKGGLTRKQRRKWQRIQAGALDTITTSTGEINTARGSIRDLNEAGDSESSMAEAMKELAEAIKEQNRIQSGVQAVGSREALRMLSDVISGEIVGKRAAPVNSYPGVRY